MQGIGFREPEETATREAAAPRVPLIADCLPLTAYRLPLTADSYSD